MGIYQGPYCEGCDQINLAGATRLVVKRITITGRRGNLKRKEEVVATFCDEDCLRKGVLKRIEKEARGEPQEKWLDSDWKA